MSTNSNDAFRLDGALARAAPPFALADFGWVAAALACLIAALGLR